MADTVLSPVLQLIFEKLASPILQKLGDIWELKENFQKLGDTLLMVQAVIEDAEEQRAPNKVVGIWLRRLKDAVYDAQDLLDEFTVKARFERSVNAEKVRKTLQVLEVIASEGLKLNSRECVTISVTAALCG